MSQWQSLLGAPLNTIEWQCYKTGYNRKMRDISMGHFLTTIREEILNHIMADLKQLFQYLTDLFGILQQSWNKFSDDIKIQIYFFFVIDTLQNWYFEIAWK